MSPSPPWIHTQYSATVGAAAVGFAAHRRALQPIQSISAALYICLSIAFMALLSPKKGGRLAVSTRDFVRQQAPKDGLLRRHTFDRFMRWDADLPDDLVERMWHDPHALLSEADKLQDKLRCSVAKLDHPAGPFVWKHSNWGTLQRTLKRSLSQSPSVKSWNDARLLISAGVPTPRPARISNAVSGRSNGARICYWTSLRERHCIDSCGSSSQAMNLSAILLDKWLSSGNSSMTCACGTTTSRQRICSSIGTARYGSSILRECVAFKIAGGCGGDKFATSTIFSIRATGGKTPVRRKSSAASCSRRLPCAKH